MTSKMMKQLLVVLLFLAPVFDISAAATKEYIVYSVAGKAFLVEGRQETELHANVRLKPNSMIKIENESAVTVLDEKNSKMFSFTKKGTNSVKSLVDLATNKGKNLPKLYVEYLVKELANSSKKKMVHPDSYMQVSATVFRSESNEKQFVNEVFDLFTKKDQGTLSAESMMVDKQILMSTDMDVHFELVSCATGNVVTKEVAGNSACYVRVRNRTMSPLYVNVLNIDRSGNKYLVLPMYEDLTCSNLFVPADCTVSFTNEPFIFPEGQSDETFVLFASEEPVNFSVLMSPLKREGEGKMKVGVFRQFYQVK